MEIQRHKAWWVWWMNRTPSKAVTTFDWALKKCMILSYSDGRQCIFCWLILDAFHQVLLSVGLTGSNCCWNLSFGFLTGAQNRGLPSNPTAFFLELFLHWSPVAYWAPTDLGSSSFSVLSFCLFILFMGFSRQEYWSGLPFPSPVDHVLSELSTLTCPSWVALHGMAHSFTELDKTVCGPCDQIG